jgi:hypothetical protein
MAMLALSYNASTCFVKRTWKRPHFSPNAVATFQRSKKGGAAAATGKQRRLRSTAASRAQTGFDFRSPEQVSGTPSALLGSRSRRRRRGDYFVSRDDASTTYPFVILSKLSPRYGDHARHGILHVSHNQGERGAATGTRHQNAGCRAGSTVRVQLWERRLSGSARRTQVAVDASPIPAIRLLAG